MGFNVDELLQVAEQLKREKVDALLESIEDHPVSPETLGVLRAIAEGKKLLVISHPSAETEARQVAGALGIGLRFSNCIRPRELGILETAVLDVFSAGSHFSQLP